MSHEIDAKSRFSVPHAAKPTPGRTQVRRRSPWRLARGGVIILGVSLAIGVVVLNFFPFPKEQAAQAAIECEACGTHPPEPGPGRSWEVDIPVSTYSRVNTRHGNLFTAIPIVSWSGRGPDMNMMLYHNSANAISGYSIADVVGFDLGPGWSLSYSDHLRFDVYPNPTRVTVVADDGTRDVFTWNGTIWVPHWGVHDQLTEVSTNVWQLKHKDQSYHEFEHLGSSLFARLKRVVDATDKEIRVTYVSGILQEIKDASQRNLKFVLSTTTGRLNWIEDPIESNEPSGSTLETRYWTFSYTSTGPLERIHDYRMNHDNSFYYSPDGRLLFVTDTYSQTGDPAVWYTYGYDSGGRLNYVLDPVGGLTQGFTYTCEKCPYGSQGQFWSLDLYTDYTDRRGNLWRYHFWVEQGVSVPTAYLRDIWSPTTQRTFVYDGDRNLLRYCDRPSGVFNCWNSSYDSQGNRLTLTDPLGHVQNWTYDAFNNVTSSTDAEGNVTQFKYETSVPTLVTRIIECPAALANPQDDCIVDGGAPTTTLAYYLDGSSGHGQLMEVVDPNGVWTGFTYDQWGQQKKYSEGRVTPNPDPVYYREMTTDSGGRTVYTKWGGQSTAAGGGGTALVVEGGCGSTDYNGANQPTDSDCPTCWNVAGEAQVEALQSQGFPPVPCSLTAAALPLVYATFSNATYSPKGELTSLPLILKSGGSTFTRTHTASFDGLGRQTQSKVVSNEAGPNLPPRQFDYVANWGTGGSTRTGPDGVQTFVQLDADHRVQYVRRGPATAPLMTANYTYLGNDLVRSVTYGNGTSTWYTYDAARRVTRIEHRNPAGGVMLALAYQYHNNDLPSSITESGSTAGAGSTTTYAYDLLRRLTHEVRSGANGYDLTYVYDKGGNRTRKIEYRYNPEEVLYRTEYTYDYQAPSTYASNNNRLMKSETYEMRWPWLESQLLSTTWYYYTVGGNVSRVVTREEEIILTESMSMMSGGGDPLSMEGSTAASAVGGEGGFAAAAAPPPPTGTQYSAVRFGYAHNGQAMVFAHNESWTWDGVSACPVVGSYQITWAREFRYDGARARYMNQPLNPSTFTPFVPDTTVWTDYDGDQTYGDFTVSGTTVTDTNSYQPGLWRRMKVGTNFVPDYLHNDHLGTLRQTTGTTGAASGSDVFTAFGERQAGSSDRFGYVGASGYQAATSDTPGDPYVTGFPYLHVGARYYDPSSGQFLQRDRIGIMGGRNVYGYVGNSPTARLDAYGLWPMDGPPPSLVPVPGSSGDKRDETQRDFDFYFGAALCSAALLVDMIIWVLPELLPISPYPVGPEPVIGPELPRPVWPKDPLPPVKPSPPIEPGPPYFDPGKFPNWPTG